MISHLYTSARNNTKKIHKAKKKASPLSRLSIKQRERLKKEIIAITSQYEKVSRLNSSDSATIRFAYKRMVDERTHLLKSMKSSDHGY
ncbi:MAG: hypothetical protein OXE99_11065 [Cellvibrionales bacterium]|nr:hypothetical protein [Cellvibrionales bacterium]